ncbi:MAG TPA: 3-deoxy-manno-octulosonate-8-phosphatase KdsC [Gammaproteobacteria bacterium]|jgi:3-deoxy-D-manno-octulosonate 8-phosphate phosphatase (KDO 8-P phosphatase)|nr:3-deoxy-manno-octulosonate-8-phosphatase KdsC [Gammaproteobacteria bacterium]
MTSQQDLIARAKNIKLIVFDVDGVLTDGGLYRSDDGQETKRFNARDGLGMRLLQRTGITLAIITGRSSQVVEHRARELGIEHVYQGQKAKETAFADLCERLNLQPSDAAYMGDDLIDLPVLTRAGLALAVADAHPEVLSRCHWASQHTGGRGAAREACELIMKHQGTWESTLAGYLA